MQEQLLSLQEVALNEIKDASSIEAVENLRVKYLGKKGELTAILKEMGKLSKEERPVIGQVANTVRESIEGAITLKKEEAKAIEKAKKLAEEVIDVIAGRGPDRRRQADRGQRGRGRERLPARQQLRQGRRPVGQPPAHPPDGRQTAARADGIIAPKEWGRLNNWVKALQGLTSTRLMRYNNHCGEPHATLAMPFNREGRESTCPRYAFGKMNHWKARCAVLSARLLVMAFSQKQGKGNIMRSPA